MERKNVATINGDSLTLVGEEIKIGQYAPRFIVRDANLSEKGLENFKDKIKLIASVPSLDTPVCDLQIKRFNDEAVSMSKDIQIIFISMDLPFAQKRFCQTYNIKNVKVFSDHKDANFGINYGVLIKELRLLSRAVFIIDMNDVVRYSQYVKEVSLPPDYADVLKALKTI
ncbi:MAG: thiol peroxidase, partial [Candidatus Omnitrophica bacterium]|nr:thiol peroxidase [Candidatus Omnitrophota bacterium]